MAGGVPVCGEEGLTLPSIRLSQTLSSGLCLDSHQTLTTTFRNNGIASTVPLRKPMRANRVTSSFPKVTFREFSQRSSNY